MQYARIIFAYLKSISQYQIGMSLTIAGDQEQPEPPTTFKTYKVPWIRTVTDHIVIVETLF